MFQSERSFFNVTSQFTALLLLCTQVTFRKVENFFVILFRARSPSAKKLYVALDDVEVEDGPCQPL